MAFENLTRYLCDPGPPPESKIWGVEMDYSLWEMLEDNVEVGETALLSHHEIAFYLKIHEDEGLKTLEQLARLQLPDSCHPRIPLLAPDARSAILQISKKAQSGEVLNYDAVLDDRPRDRLSFGDPDSRVVDALLEAMEWKSGPRPLTDVLDLPPHSVSVKLVWGGVRRPAYLFPSNVNRSERAVWSEAGFRLSNEAAIRLFRPREKMSMTGNRSADSVYLQQIAKKYPGLRISMQGYININGFNLVLEWTADGTTNFRQMRDRCVAEIRADFRRSLEGVMADVDLVRSVFQASADSYIAEKIPSYDLESGEQQPVSGPLASGEDGLRQVVQHVTTTQDIAEAREGEDLARRRAVFLSELQKGLEAYAKRDKDFRGLAVGLLNPEEATMGYRMVYVPPSGGGRPAQVHLSMSTVGTMRLRSREEVLHDLARGMIRHKERKQKIDAASLEKKLMEFLKDAVSMDLVEKKERG